MIDVLQSSVFAKLDKHFLFIESFIDYHNSIFILAILLLVNSQL